MFQYRRLCFLSISLLLLFTLCKGVYAQTLYPVNAGDKAKYAAIIEMPKAYLSGICLLYHDSDNKINGCLFNEFGISALDFTYDENKDKVKLHHVIKMMNKWYIKKVLRRDLRELIHQLRTGNGSYTNERFHLRYQFTPIETNE